MAEIPMIAGDIAATKFALKITGKIMQALIDPIKTEGQRAGADRINSSTYGMPIPLIFGERNRIAGNLIWAGELVETKKRQTSGGKGGSPEVESTTYSYSRSFAFLVGERIATITRVWANGKLVFSQNTVPVIPDAGEVFAGGNGLIYNSITVYPGSATQNPDPTIEAALGSGNVPGYRYVSYVVINTLQLADFGNSTPNLEFEVVGEAATTGAIVNEICERAGLGTDEYHIDGQMTDTVDGFIVSAQTDAISATEPLQKAFAFDAAEYSGAIRFTRRGKHMAAAIELGDMAARSPGGGDVLTPLQTTREPDFKLPKTATLTYYDYSRDYQENTQTSFRYQGSAETKLNVNMQITMESSAARKIVDRLLWEPWTSRMTCNIRLSDKYQFLKPTDVVALPVADAWLPFRVESKTRGADGIIDLSLVMDDPFIYDGSTAAEEAQVPDNETLVAGDTFAMPINMPIIAPNEPAAGFNYVIDAESDGWRGGQIMRSIDGGTTYSTIGRSGTRNTTGTVAVATPAASADFWDRETVIEVELLFDGHELESLTELEVLNGRNACWIGAADGSRGEIIQFATATLISSSPRVYELSDLLRGRRATEHEIELHTNDEIFVLFESGLMATTDFTVTDWDRERVYKGVSVLQLESDVVDTQLFINSGEKARPRSPVHGRGARDGSGDVVITWKRRTRHFSPGIGYGLVAMDEQTESYQIDVYDGVTVVRTISSSTTSATYTSAQQTADGLTPGDPVDIRIYQISATRGRGHAGVFTI